MVNYEFLLQNQLIRPLETVEKEKYAQFHKQNYKIDLASIQQFLELQNAKSKTREQVLVMGWG